MSARIYEQLVNMVAPLVTVTAKKVSIANHISDRRQVNSQVARWTTDTITVAGIGYDAWVSQFDTVGYCYDAETMGRGWWRSKKATEQHIHDAVVQRIAGAILAYRADYPEQFDTAMSLLTSEEAR